MKKLIILALLGLSLGAQAQLNVEGQIGGSNYLGATARAEALIKLSEVKSNSIGISIGLGASLHEGSMIYQSGVHYYHNNWGFGSEISGFNAFPYSSYANYPGLAFITYPNVNYTFSFSKGRYLKASLGVLLAFDETYESDITKSFSFAGDPIPGFGISYGLRYKRE